VSSGCTNCYAEIQAARATGPGQPYEGLAETRADGAHWTGKMMFVDKHLEDPLRWQKPRRIFVNSMSDLFHENVPDEWIDRIFAVMALSPKHTFQILTKRSERMRDYMNTPGRDTKIWWAARPLAQSRGKDIYDVLPVPGPGMGPKGIGIKDWPLSNVWLGVSTEDQAAADERIPHLMGTSAAVTFISAEPLLGPIDIDQAMYGKWENRGCNGFGFTDGFGYEAILNWVIVGGESGENFRPMQKEWAESMRKQCADAHVPFFFKQDSDLKPGQRSDLLGKVIQEMPTYAGVV
jgi:protein gp37